MQCVWVEAEAFFLYQHLCCGNVCSANRYSKEQKMMGKVLIQNVCLHCVSQWCWNSKQERLSKSPKMSYLFLQLHILPPPPRSLLSHLYFSSRKHTFFSPFNIFLQQRHVCFSDRWQEAHDGKKSLFTIRTDVRCLWTILLIKSSTRFWSLTDSRWEWAGKKRVEGKHREKKKRSVPLFPTAMKRDFDFQEKNQVSSPQLFLKWDFVCSWWSVIL